MTGFEPRGPLVSESTALPTEPQPLPPDVKGFRAVPATQLAEWSLPTPEDPGSNHLIT